MLWHDFLDKWEQEKIYSLIETARDEQHQPKSIPTEGASYYPGLLTIKNCKPPPLEYYPVKLTFYKLGLPWHYF